MMRRTMNPWSLVPAMLLAAFVWVGSAHAQGRAADAPDAPGDDDIEMDFEFDGPDFAFDEEFGDFGEFGDFAEDGGAWIADGGGGDFDGPGGLSAPAPREGARMRGDRESRTMERRVVIRRRGMDGRMGHAGPGGPAMGRRGGPRGMAGGRSHGMRGHLGAMAEHLGLTDRQKEQMADLHEARARKMIAVRSGLAEARLDLRKLMRADAPDRAKIDATIDRMARLRADAQKSGVAMHLDAMKVLTPEQRQKMKDVHGGMGPHGGGAGGPRDGMHEGRHDGGAGHGPHGGRGSL